MSVCKFWSNQHTVMSAILRGSGPQPYGPSPIRSVTHFRYLLQSSPISRRQLHHLHFEPLFSGISHHRLREHRRLVIRRDPWRHTLLWMISCDIPVDCRDELVVKTFDVRVCGEEMTDLQEEFILSELAYLIKKSDEPVIHKTSDLEL